MSQKHLLIQILPFFSLVDGVFFQRFVPFLEFVTSNRRFTYRSWRMNGCGRVWIVVEWHVAESLMTSGRVRRTLTATLSWCVCPFESRQLKIQKRFKNTSCRLINNESEHNKTIRVGLIDQKLERN